MKMRLPIGIQTFRKLRKGGYRYVDKTPWARRMADGESGYYFLSRPRRFGKSLFLDMLGELFQGSEDLFEGLAIHSDWDWMKRHPVVRLSFGKGSFRTPELLAGSAMARLDEVERRTGVASSKDTAPERLAELLEFLHDHTGHRAVVLVDEYDKPILDMLETPELARANRDFLRDLYGTIKGSDEHIRFVFLTGVSRFSKVNLFSGLNNLEDITLDPRYSSVCGYTEADLDETFGEEMAGLDRNLVREWYNGYSWLGEERVYNPYDVLLLLKRREFKNWWYRTGTPTFLPPLLVNRLLQPGMAFPAPDRMTIDEEDLDAFDVDGIVPAALLFQTGYLTVAGQTERDGMAQYRLDYPNREVRQSFSRSLLTHFFAGPFEEGKDGPAVVDGSIPSRGPSLGALLEANDFDGLERHFRAFFAGAPHQWYSPGKIDRYEGHWANVIRAGFHFGVLDLHLTAEDSGSRGRADLVVRHAGQVFVFEFKMVPPAKRGAAMAQMKARGYADKYGDLGGPVHLIGMEFSAEERNLVGFDVASG